MPIPAAAGMQVVGTPRLRMTYSGTAAPARTHVFAQLVDVERDVVVGNQVTPIPVTLDGAEHTVELPMESIASLSTASGYELQIVAASSVYDIQRSAGTLEIADAGVALPVGRPYARAARTCMRYPFGSRKSDRLLGSRAADCLRGRAGRDRINGLGGDDDLSGGRGRDRIRAGAGNDRVKVAGGSRDRVDCGPGRDTVIASKRTDRLRNCERVRLR